MKYLYDLFLHIVKPFVKKLGKLHFPFTRKKFTGKHYYKVRDLVEVGDIFLTTTYGEISNYINPAKIKHAAIYIGKEIDGICYVMEATGKGVIKTDLVSFLTSKDVVVGVKPTFLREDDKALLPLEAKRYEGVPYDYLFKKSKKYLYCFELVAHVLKGLRPELSLKCTEIVRQKPIYDPATFLNDKEKFTIYFDSRKMNL